MTSTLELLRSQLSDTEDIESDLALLGLQNKVADSSLEELAQKILAEQDHGEGLETPLLSKNKDYTETPAIFDQSIDTFIDVCKQQQEAVSVATKEGRKPPVVSCAQLREKKLPDWLLLSKGKVWWEMFQDALEVTLISLSMELTAPVFVKQILAGEHMDLIWKSYSRY